MAEVIFPGAAGRVEGRYQEPSKEGAPIALILHGHPRAGGSMQDRVTVQLYKLFADYGFGVLRFNFEALAEAKAFLTTAWANYPTPPPPSTTCRP